jgi:hypothetical protein
MNQKQKIAAELKDPFLRRKAPKIETVKAPTELKNPTKSAHRNVSKATYGASDK